MKKILALILVLVLTLGVMASCFNTNDVENTTTTTTTTGNGGTPPTTEPTCNVHVDEDVDYICDMCGVELERPSNPPVTPDCTEHKDENNDYLCDNCGAGLEKPEVPVEGSIEVTFTGFSFETIFCEWKPLQGAESYNVYCDGKKVDTELIRNYGSYYRCDILGLKAGEYTIDIYAVDNGEEVASTKTTFKKTTIAHVREGFAFVNGTSSGAYNDDGTLKSNAVVIYVTNTNKNTVTATLSTGTFTGLSNILAASSIKKCTTPICVRFIGNITDLASGDAFDKGDLLIDNQKNSNGITLEGVGNDATFNGFGLRLKNASNIEIRNIGFMNCDSGEGDSISLQQSNDHIWVHNCDIFYGMAGSDADQNKGDGALDTKKSTYITHSFNHFYDTGKSHLLGNSGETEENYLSYHHNWYDHSDSRHPRVRTATVHVYNNFYDGVSKYGIGATEGASIFAENNYFLNTNYAMLISMQGSDIAGDNEGTFSSEDGGIIKAFGNVYVGTGHPVVTYQQNSTQFDCYLASTRDEKVPSSVVATKGGADYNNFDTSSVMYEYNVQTPEQAMATVKAYAGRVQGGDFKWEFPDSENTNYDIIPELKAALVNYKGTLVSTNVDNSSSNENGSNNVGENGGNNGGDNGGTDTPVTPTPTGTIVHDFTTNGKDSNFFTIEGNLSTSKGTVEYNGLTLTRCLKMESSTHISFIITEAKTLTLVFVEATPNIKVDGEKITSNTSIITVKLEAGTHTITKADTNNLFYIVLE